MENFQKSSVLVEISGDFPTHSPSSDPLCFFTLVREFNLPFLSALLLVISKHHVVRQLTVQKLKLPSCLLDTP